MFRKLLCLVLVLAAIAGFALPVSAAPYGSSRSQAVSVTLGTYYSKSWTKDNYNKDYYVKFSIGTRGIVNIRFAKPTDSRNNMARLDFYLYDSKGTMIWDNYGAYSLSNRDAFFDMNVGLAAGTYYLNIKAPFSVSQGSITSSFCLSHTKDAYCEIESNETKQNATTVQLNKTYRGWLGTDGGYNTGVWEVYDYYKFAVNKGDTYRLQFEGNYSPAGTYTLIKWVDPNGLTRSWTPGIDGMQTYYEYTASESGTAYLYLYNHYMQQYEYRFRISNQSCHRRGHQYQDTVTYPTAAANGYTTRTCTLCNYTCRENYTFPDVRRSDWYYNAVEFSVGQGYFSGYSSGKFGPGDEITRQDFVVVLARIEGVDLKKYAGRTDFKDVMAGSYYESAIKWASSTGVVSGYKNGKFGVGDKLTREQLVTILYRYAQKKGCNMSVSNASMKKLNAFSDSGKITSYAKNPCAWALQNGVLGGLNATTFGPQRNANRAQVAQILMNICKNKVIPF